MNLSDYAIEALGFKKVPAGDSLEAVFHSLHVFEARGFLLSDERVVVRTGITSGVAYDIGIGSSINDVSKGLLGDEFTNDEAKWATEHKCAGPYVVIHFGPTELHTVWDGFVKNEEGEIISYDSFPAARNELRELEMRGLASLETALACSLGSIEAPVRLVPIETTVFGITPDKVVVHDIRITGSASGYVSRPIQAEALEQYLEEAIELAADINPRVSQFFQLGMRDQDELKRFLYYFLAIEIETHRVFRSISRETHLQNAATFESRTAKDVEKVFLTKVENWKSLADRFVWCVASVWTHLSGDDIAEFKRLKKIRDDIAHGNTSRPAANSVIAVENLAKKLYQFPRDS